MDILLDDPQLANLASEMLKALGHPLRLRIVAILAQSEANVTQLTEQLSASQPIVSQQLRILRMGGLVQSRREDGHAVYRLIEPHLKDMLNCIENCLHNRRQGP